MTQPPTLVPGRLLRLNFPDPQGQPTPLPYHSPDAWTAQPGGTPPPVAHHVGFWVIGGRTHLLFRDQQGWLWAQPMVARRWDEGLRGVRSNQPEDQPHGGALTQTLTHDPGWGGQPPRWPHP